MLPCTDLALAFFWNFNKHFKSGTKQVIQKFKQGLTNQYVILGAILGTYLSVIFWLAGYKYTLAGRAAIYNQLSTVFIIILARVFLKEPMTSKKDYWSLPGNFWCNDCKRF